MIRIIRYIFIVTLLFSSCVIYAKDEASKKEQLISNNDKILLKREKKISSIVKEERQAGKGYVSRVFVPLVSVSKLESYNAAANPYVLYNYDDLYNSRSIVQHYFSSFQKIGYSLFFSKKNIKYNAFVTLAKVNKVDAIVISRKYVVEKKLYIYDVMYLRGNIDSKKLIWNTNMSNFGLVNEKVEYSNIDIYNYMQQAGLISSIDPNQITQDDIQNQIERVQVLARNIEGVWVNYHTKKMIVIRKLSDSVIAKHKNTLINAEIIRSNKELKERSKVVGLKSQHKDKNENNIYGAFILDAKGENSSGRDINKYLNWSNGDLKIIFNASNKKGIVISNAKIPIKVVVNNAYIRGYTSIYNKSGYHEYYIPLIDINRPVLDYLYKYIPKDIAIPEFDYYKNYHKIYSSDGSAFVWSLTFAATILITVLGII